MHETKIVLYKEYRVSSPRGAPPLRPDKAGLFGEGADDLGGYVEEEDRGDEGEGEDEDDEGVNSEPRRVVRVELQHGVG